MNHYQVGQLQSAYVRNNRERPSWSDMALHVHFCSSPFGERQIVDREWWFLIVDSYRLPRTHGSYATTFLPPWRFGEPPPALET